MNFTSLLTSTCNIQTKAISRNTYEPVVTWSAHLSNVACRMDSSNSPSYRDVGIRVNDDQCLFFFNPDVDIKRGYRIDFDGDFYDVIKVNKCFGQTEVHHLEVVAKVIDHD